ncbi:MAG: hypothetical protein HDR88_04595 [Bacteroides sp.]|nr:hypothetical protein [Bacteroides sp.]
MENTQGKHSGNSDQIKDNKRFSQRDPLQVIGIIAGSLVGVIVILLIGVSLYLTPDRLKHIISEEASKNLEADVRVGRIDYTLWSSFPNLRVAVDSIEIDSRTLDDVPAKVMSTLPSNSKQLLTMGGIKGAINVFKALKGDIELKDIEIINTSCNLVQVNDSVNNFKIFPKLKGGLKVPHIAFNTVNIVGPVKVNWVDIASDMKCEASVDKARLEGIKDKKDNYVFGLDGNIDLHSPEISTINTLPIKLNGNVALGFSPLTMTVTDCKVDMADLKTISDISVIAEGKKIVIGKCNLDLSCSDLLAMTGYFVFPEESKLRGITGMLPVFAKLTLDSPYEVPSAITTSSQLPPFTLSVDIPAAQVDYPLDAKNHLNLRDVMLQTELNIDPRNVERSAILIQLAKGYTDGIAFDMSGKISDLMSGDPLLDMDVKCNADLSKAASQFIIDNRLQISGKLEGGSSVTCRLSGLKEKQLKDVNFVGDFKVSSLKINDAVSKLTGDLQALSVKLNGTMPMLSTAGLGESKLNLAVASQNGKLNVGTDTTAVAFNNFSFNGQFGAKGTVASPTLGGKINLAADKLDVLSPGMRFNSAGIGINMVASMRNIPWSPTINYSTTPASTDDSILTHRVTHTPLYLTASIPSMLQTVFSLVNLNADVKIKDAILYADGYPARNELSDVSLSTDLDKLSVNKMHISTRGADADLTGNVNGLRGFLMSSSPVPLKIDMEAKFKDVDINRLAGNYYDGQALLTGKPANYHVAPLGEYTAADSLCVLIPRNLYANIHLHSDRAEYMEWQFSPLSTTISLHDGVATLGNLSIGSGFGNVAIDWTYSTADLNDIFMKLNVGVNDFDINNFFKTFPQVTASAPEMENLSGKLSADIEGKALMFPSMFVNAPSMHANVNLHASEMAFKKEGKIKTITDLMLIKGDSALTVNNLDIHGSFHDNMLQLDPFMIECGPYKLGVAGVNNLQGEMYYHLGLHRSPLHMPFGVNLVGNWRHPGIRFGGAGINDSRERDIAANLSDNVDVNIMRQLKHGWQLFVEIAAKYDAENNQHQALNVD